MVTPINQQTFMTFRWDLEKVKTFGRLQTDKAAKKGGRFVERVGLHEEAF